MRGISMKAKIRKWTVPLLACGMMWGASSALAQANGDVIGFRVAWPTEIGDTFYGAGDKIQFVMRLAGPFVVNQVSGSIPIPSPNFPVIWMKVGSEGSVRPAELQYFDYVDHGLPTARTDLVFEYTVRPGDMASPLLINGSSSVPFSVFGNDYTITDSSTGAGVDWRVDPMKWAPITDTGFTQYDVDLSTLDLKIATLSFQTMYCPSSILASEMATCRIGMGAPTTSEAIVLKVWTPDTANLEIINTLSDGAATVTIPAGSTYIDFPIRGVSDTPPGSPARIYAQRPSDFTHNPTPFVNEAGITNYIRHVVAVEPPPNPTVKIIFPQNMNLSTLEINEAGTSSGQFKIALSETYASDVWVQVDVQNIAGENNISLTPPVGGYRVPANQLESSGFYSFIPLDGTPGSEYTGVALIPTVTNAVASGVFQDSTPGMVYVKNVLPTIAPIVSGTAVVGMPLDINWTIQDVPVDLLEGIITTWYFGPGEGMSVVQTNAAAVSSPIINGMMTHVYSSAGTKAGWVRVSDKDSPGLFTEVPFTVVVDPPAPSAYVSVEMDNYRYVEGVNADLWVKLSEPCVDPVTVSLTAELGGVDQLGVTLQLSTTTVTIPMGWTNNVVPVNVTFLDGTTDTAGLGITISPTIVSTPTAITQFPDSMSWPVYVTNAPPVIVSPSPGTTPVVPYDAVPQGLPFTYTAMISDVQADIDTGMTVRWQFDGGAWIYGAGAAGFYSLTHTLSASGVHTVNVQALDKDGGVSSLVSFPVLVVPPTPAPHVLIGPEYQIFNETVGNGTFYVRLSEPFTQQFTVQLDVTPPASIANGRITLPQPTVTFSMGQTERQVLFSIQDGTDASALNGFLVTPSIALGQPGNPDAFYTGIPLPGTIYVQNVEPVIQQPISGSTGTVATVGIARIFPYVVSDASVDVSTGITLRWQWGDGSPDTVMMAYTGSGEVSHTYTVAAEQRTVILTATDKDGAFSQSIFYVTVKDAKRVIAIPIGPNNASFHGMPGTGTGTITSPDATMPPQITGSFAGQDLYYTFYFDTVRKDAIFNAHPDLAGTDRPFDGAKSYFFVWDGPVDAFLIPDHATVPLYAGENLGVTVINLPDSDGQSETMEIRAVFSREYQETASGIIGDGCGDINRDGIPDRDVARYFANLDDGGAGGDAINPIWFQNLAGYNDDNDFTPANPDGIGGVFDFRPVPNGGDNLFTAMREIRGIDGLLGDQWENDILYNDDPGTDPTLEDTDGDGFPDGWEYWFWERSYFRGKTGGRSGWRYDPLNVGQGTPISPYEIMEAFNPSSSSRNAIAQAWRQDFDNDGLLDIEELVLGTDPTNWDTDGDGMADGWEVLMGLNPCDSNDGLDWTRNNPDGDYFAIAAVPRLLVTITVSNEVTGLDEPVSVTTRRYLARVAVGDTPQVGSFTTCYHYGDDNAPWAVGRPVEEDPDWLAADVAEYSFEPVDALLLHFQVRDEFGFDPRVAWCGAVPRFPGARVNTGTDLRAADSRTRLLGMGIGRWGPYYVSDAPFTRPFTSVDEYLLMKFMFELGLEGADAIGPYYDENGNYVDERYFGMRSRGGNDWFSFSTHPRTPDTGATPQAASGVPDGWKLYIATAPGTTAFVHSPWNNLDGSLIDADGDRLVLQREFWGTDSLTFYSNPAQYLATIPYFGGEIVPEQVAAAVIEFRTGITNEISVLNRGRYTASMVGVVTIARPDGHPDNNWINKFWPTDPWNCDTDEDGLRDDQEGQYFIYGTPVDDGSICIAGGGLNPCSWDTDGDSLPDAWEVCFAGSGAVVPALTPAQHGLRSVLWPEPDSQDLSIVNGQDGTVQDAGFDWDHDGLVNYEEYMTQAIRGFRYDIPAAGVAADDQLNVSGQRGLPMDMSFDIADVFTESSHVWDRVGWFMLPPMQVLYVGAYPNPPVTPFRYASTDPSNHDTDGDGMDDYYELYHGINPLLGMGGALTSDRVAWAYSGAVTYNINWWTATYGLTYDFVQFPWLNGMPMVDPDADGLLNAEEMLLANSAAPASYNSDPSPLWMTEPSNPNSIVGRFYRTAGTGAYPSMGTWWGMGLFMYSFEMNEGYDTDNDGISDKDELIGNRNAKSDPRNSEDPFHRQAMWFSGTNSAAATPVVYHDIAALVGGDLGAINDMEQAFRSFTVELWVRPERTDREQVLIERVFNYGTSDIGALPGSFQRRNFLIGIAADGRAYAGYDGAGSHEQHTDTVRLFGQQILLNKWTHLAARMDGRAQTFTLFVNGVAQDTMDTALIPANGVLLTHTYPESETEETTSTTYRSGALVLGAANNVTSSIGMRQRSYGTWAEIVMTWPATWDQYDKFYQGWMAEVRVWDGARSNVEINNDFNRRLSYDDMMNNRRLVQTELLNGASRIENAPLPVSPLLMNYYTFNSLFSELREQDVAVVPRGFNNPAVTTNRPANANALWWEDSEVTSTVYTDKQYLPWIQNLVAHLPLYVFTTDTNGVLLAYGDGNVVADSYYWRTDQSGTILRENSFPNRNNPYGFAYTGSAYARGVNSSADLLPMGDAWAKQCLDLWDGQGPTGTWLENAGTLDDGLPQWWLDLHGITTNGGWNNLYEGNNPFYQDSEMENGEVYRREQAKGMKPDGTINPAYAQTADSDGDGLPDWWENLYGLDPMDPTGDYGAGGDPDMDGLSNYAEYLISEVYGFRLSSPRKFKTIASQVFSDYYVMLSKVPLGFMFSDHDFVEDWWEDPYAPTHANRFVYDPHIDYESDGWSNWSEARYSLAVRPVRPDLVMQVAGNDGTLSYEFPIPIVKAYLAYQGIQVPGNAVTIHAYSDPEMNGQPDATWSVVLGGGLSPQVLPLGAFSPRTVSTYLSPGSVAPGTLQLQLTHVWTGQAFVINPLDGPGGIDEFNDIDGVLYASVVAGITNVVGEVDYATGKFTFDMSIFQGRTIVDSPIDEYRLDLLYQVSLPDAWPQTLYLGMADTGYLHEGTNYFVAFMDLDNSVSWDPGEPMGIATPFGTVIGWDVNTVNFQLTDYTPGYLRMSFDGARTEDVIFGDGSSTGGGGGPGGSGGQGGTQSARVRVLRTLLGYSTGSRAEVLDKVVTGRNYIHEGDFLTSASAVLDGQSVSFALDWGALASDVTAVYEVYLGDEFFTTNGTLIATFTNSYFTAAPAKAVATLPMNGSYVYSARPTFRWSMPEDYTAFAFEIRKSTSSGTLLYPIRVRQVPVRDPITGDCVWEAPFYIGDKDVVNNGLYYWRVAPLNSKFTVPTSASWSTWSTFRWDVNQPIQSSGYGQINVTVRYFGPAVNLADKVVLQAFDNRGFTGNPAAQYIFPAGTPQLALVTDLSNTATNAFLRGLTPGTYYLRAFIDSNNNGVRDSWESWGYANYYGEQRAMYNVRPVKVDFSTLIPAAQILIEDCDVDQDWFPDAWEYEQHPGAYPGFLQTIGPAATWLFGDAEINPDLDYTAGWSGIPWLLGPITSGQTQESIIAMLAGYPLADDGFTLAQKVEMGLMPSDKLGVRITKSPRVDPLSADVTWEISITKDPAANEDIRSLMDTPQNIYVYNLMYSPTLDNPKWTSVQLGSFPLDEGVETIPLTVDVPLKGIDPARGFFKIEVKRQWQ